MTQHLLLWVSTWKIWKHLFLKIYVFLCLLQHYSLWPRHGNNDDWVKKMWHMYTMEHYSAIRKDEILPTWRDLENIMLCEVIQTEKSRIIWLHSYVGYKVDNNKWTKTKKETKIHRQRQQYGGKGRWEGGDKDKGGQMYGDRRRFYFGW